jgi:hypothetical protein
MAVRAKDGWSEFLLTEWTIEITRTIETRKRLESNVLYDVISVLAAAMDNCL